MVLYSKRPFRFQVNPAGEARSSREVHMAEVLAQLFGELGSKLGK